MVLNKRRRPRILLFPDQPGWAFHTIADAIQHHLADRFECIIEFASDQPRFVETDFDLIHVFFDRETRHLPSIEGRVPLLKSVYNHGWREDGLLAMDEYMQRLREAHAVSVPNNRLLKALEPIPLPVFLCPEGVDTAAFSPSHQQRTGPLVVGWAGNPGRPVKRIEMLKQACEGICELRLATGDLNQREMIDFYRGIDVIACTSASEGSPRTLLEGMSCGAAPVSTDVGIARDLIRHGENGFLITDATIHGLRKTMHACVENIREIRNWRAYNREIIRAARDWRVTAQAQAQVYETMLSRF